MWQNYRFFCSRYSATKHLFFLNEVRSSDTRNLSGKISYLPGSRKLVPHFDKKMVAPLCHVPDFALSKGGWQVYNQTQ